VKARSSWRGRITRFLVPSLLLFSAAVAAGQGPPPRGQFGEYREHNPLLRTAAGDTFTVFRVKYWTFDQDPHALQLEYASPGPVSDTLAVRAMVRRIWPSFAPYVERLGLDAALVTATNFERTGSFLAWNARFQSFTVTIRRDASGQWRPDGAREPLPPAEAGGPPRIFRPDGQPMPFPSPPTNP